MCKALHDVATWLNAVYAADQLREQLLWCIDNSGMQQEVDAPEAGQHQCKLVGLQYYLNVVTAEMVVALPYCLYLLPKVSEIHAASVLANWAMHASSMTGPGTILLLSYS